MKTFFRLFLNLIGMSKETPFTPDPNVQKRALCIAINDYPGTSNDLRGCINDGVEWMKILKTQYGFQSVTELFNQQATIENVKKELVNIISLSNPGDVMVFTYSGHGTSIKDVHGDESDGKDEAICLHNGLLIDDEIRNMMTSVKKGVKLIIVSDSCFSGTVTRAALKKNDNSHPIARYMPPSDGNVATMISSSKFNPLKKMFKSLCSEEDMKEILISGCSDNEVSYDANFNGKYFGAMSYFATKILNENPGITYNEFYKELREKLPNSQYPQTPQLEGSCENKNKIVFS